MSFSSIDWNEFRSYADIGGMDIQKQEIREAVELPLTQFDLYRQIGIDPPRGVLLYGPPGSSSSPSSFLLSLILLARIGTGKTMLVKAVAHHTTAAFIRVVGSEFVQKYLGEGPRMVRDVFRMARENAPAIIFIDEIDAIATKRFDAQTGADREVQRILLELLNQMDGFDQSANVKVIMATNRADTLVCFFIPLLFHIMSFSIEETTFHSSLLTFSSRSID